MRLDPSWKLPASWDWRARSTSGSWRRASLEARPKLHQNFLSECSVSRRKKDVAAHFRSRPMRPICYCNNCPANVNNENPSCPVVLNCHYLFNSSATHLVPVEMTSASLSNQEIVFNSVAVVIETRILQTLDYARRLLVYQWRGIMTSTSGKCMAHSSAQIPGLRPVSCLLLLLLLPCLAERDLASSSATRFPKFIYKQQRSKLLLSPFILKSRPEGWRKEGKMDSSLSYFGLGQRFIDEDQER